MEKVPELLGHYKFLFFCCIWPLGESQADEEIAKIPRHDYSLQKLHSSIAEQSNRPKFDIPPQYKS